MRTLVIAVWTMISVSWFVHCCFLFAGWGSWLIWGSIYEEECCKFLVRCMVWIATRHLLMWNPWLVWHTPFHGECMTAYKVTTYDCTQFFSCFGCTGSDTTSVSLLYMFWESFALKLHWCFPIDFGHHDPLLFPLVMDFMACYFL